MLTLLAIAPCGGIAVKNAPAGLPETIPGGESDPDTPSYHWSGRQLNMPALRTGYRLTERDPDWQPPDAEQATRLLRPARTITLHPSELPTSETIAAMPPEDQQLMTLAAASSIMVNTYNGTAIVAFPDGSKAYRDPYTHALKPTT